MEGYRVVTMDYAADKARHLRDRHRQFPRDHARAHEAHEGSGHRVQHRPLRQRDRSGGAQAVRLGQHQAAGRSHHLPRRQAHHPARRGAPGEFGLRHGASLVRDELLVRESGARADRALYANREVSGRACTCCRSISTRRSRGCSSRSSAPSSRSSPTRRRATSACRSRDRTRRISTGTDRERPDAAAGTARSACWASKGGGRR